MPFPWISSQIPADYAATFRDKALAMYRDEVRQRAELLLHLGYSAEEAIARCRDNLRWDFDLSGPCPIENEVEHLVQAVYRRQHKA
ncbi:MAG: hypothetical protein RMK29_03800 [Myxococcales bacterium]|nr:hypothetical protein [Myxococcota bacterium]MDW8280811.1 hypothetical protein [Myxococcales bacterium]